RSQPATKFVPGGAIRQERPLDAHDVGLALRTGPVSGAGRRRIASAADPGRSGAGRTGAWPERPGCVGRTGPTARPDAAGPQATGTAVVKDRSPLSAPRGHGANKRGMTSRRSLSAAGVMADLVRPSTSNLR